MPAKDQSCRKSRLEGAIRHITVPEDPPNLKARERRAQMDWLTSLPALLLFVTAPLMILMMVDVLTRDHSAQSVRTVDAEKARVIAVLHPDKRRREADQRSRKAA
jgi:hypothetical protein